MKVKLLIAFAVCFVFGLNAIANTYIVSSNADNGVGTFRQAITDANTNVGLDSIKFNLADSSVAGRTIILTSILPSITEVVVIDGTSQPYGAEFGISFAKIQVTASSALIQCLNVLADSCSVYGLFISGFQTGISIHNPFVKVGAVNKGNVIFNCTSACVKVESTHHVAFVANLIGVDTSQNVFSGTVGDGIQVTNSYAVAIGGHSSAASNVISGNNYGVKFENAVGCNMNGNFIGTSSGGLSAIPNSYGIRGTGASNTGIQIGGDSIYERNIISGNTHAGIYGSFSSSTIQGNYIGTDASGQVSLANGDAGIDFTTGSSNNLIGGDLQIQTNIIAYNAGEAITFQDATCQFNTIRKNNTFCNGQGGFVFNGGNENISAPAISIINANGVSGVTYPLGTIDIFQDDSCDFCEGKILIATVTTGSNGVYVYNGPLSGNITATVTDTIGNTSQYSSCVSADSNSCLIAHFTTSPDSVCQHAIISFIDQTVTAPGSEITSWQWSFGDTAFASTQFPTNTYNLAGEFTVTLIVSNTLGCSDTISKIIFVKSSPVASFTAPSPSCAGTPVDFVDQSQAGNGASLTGWIWGFDDGGSSTVQNPSHTFYTSAEYTITLSVTNSNQCTSQSQGTLSIVNHAIASFNFTLYGLVAVFNNTSITNGPVSYSWDFDDGSFSNSVFPAHTYASSGLYHVCLTVYDSLCMTSDSTCEIIDLPVGLVDPLHDEVISISPNPVHDVLTISGLSSMKVNSISIQDLVGRKWVEEKISEASTLLTLDVHSIPEGLYLVEIKSDGFVFSRKINVIH